MPQATAIDVGHESVRMVALAYRAGMPELVGVAHEPLEELGRLEEGPEKSAALKMRLSKLAGVSRLPVGDTVISISGRGTIARYVQVPPVPPWRLEALMRFEATQQAGGRTEDPTAESRSYDYRMLDVPDVEGQTALLLAISQEVAVLDRTALARAAGADDPDVDLAALGLLNAYVFGHGIEDDQSPLEAESEPGPTPDSGTELGNDGPAGPGRTVFLLDVGADELNLCIVRNGGLYFVRHQPGGGRAFTEAIRQALEISWIEAEEFKRSRGRIYADPGEAPSERDRDASEALSRQAADLARAVEAALMYARAQTKARNLGIDKILLSGGGARLEGLADFLARRLRTEVRPLEPLRKVSLGALSSNATAPLEGEYSTFAVPIGLALARVVPGGARLDLRTREDKARREFRQKGLFAWAAATVFALGVVYWIAGAVRDHHVYAEASKEAKALGDKDEADIWKLDAVRGTNDRLQAEIDALRERVASGEDLLRALSQLKKLTPPSVRLLRVSTSRPGDIKDEAPEKEVTFQKVRKVYIHGYARSSESYPDAFSKVTAYESGLAEMRDLFTQVSQRDAREIPAEQADGAARVVFFILEASIARPK